MIRIATAVLFFALAGCQGGGSSSVVDPGYGEDYDAISPLGIKVRCDYDDMCPTVEHVDKAIQAAAMCIGVSYDGYADGLFVVGTTDIPDGEEEGMYFPGFASIAVGQIDGEFWRTEVIAHEMTHHMLYEITSNADYSHNHPCFSGATLAFYLISVEMAYAEASIQ